MKALLLLLTVAVAACGTVEAEPTAKDGAGGNGAASVGGSAGGAGGAGGEIGGAGEAGHAGASGAAGATAPSSGGTTGSAGAGGGGGGASAGGGAGGGPGASSSPVCPKTYGELGICPNLVNGKRCLRCRDQETELVITSPCGVMSVSDVYQYCVPSCS